MRASLSQFSNLLVTDEEISQLLDEQTDSDSKSPVAQDLFEKAERGVLFSEVQLEQLGTYFKSPEADNNTRNSVAAILGEVARKRQHLTPKAIQGLEFCMNEDLNADEIAKKGARGALEIVQSNKRYENLEEIL